MAAQPADDELDGVCGGGGGAACEHILIFTPYMNPLVVVVNLR